MAIPQLAIEITGVMLNAGGVEAVHSAYCFSFSSVEESKLQLLELSCHGIDHVNVESRILPRVSAKSGNSVKRVLPKKNEGIHTTL